MKRFVLPLAAVVMLAGCAGTAKDDSPDPSGAPVSGTPTEGESAALALVDLWHATGAAVNSEETWLRLDAQEFQLWGECGVISGSWVATDTLFLAEPTVATDGCAEEGFPSADWLAKATSFSAGFDGYVLRDSEGEVLATLTNDGAPKPNPAVDDIFTKAPEVTDEVRAHFASAATLPKELKSVATDALVGRWIPESSTGDTEPFVSFGANGSWEGSDGCNGGQGRWAVSDSGEFLGTAGPSTLMYCEGAPVPSWVALAKSAGTTADGVLVMFDAAGAELGRLISK